MFFGFFSLLQKSCLDHSIWKKFQKCWWKECKWIALFLDFRPLCITYFFLQNNHDQLETIAILIEKHELNAKKNNFRKHTIWKKIHEDWCKITKITNKDCTALTGKWNNKMSTLRGWKRAINLSKKLTGKCVLDNNFILNLMPVFFLKPDWLVPATQCSHFEAPFSLQFTFVILQKFHGFSSKHHSSYIYGWNRSLYQK